MSVILTQTINHRAAAAVGGDRDALGSLLRGTAPANCGYTPVRAAGSIQCTEDGIRDSPHRTELLFQNIRVRMTPIDNVVVAGGPVKQAYCATVRLYVFPSTLVKIEMLRANMSAVFDSDGPQGVNAADPPTHLISIGSDQVSSDSDSLGTYLSTAIASNKNVAVQWGNAMSDRSHLGFQLTSGGAYLSDTSAITSLYLTWVLAGNGPLTNNLDIWATVTGTVTFFWLTA